MHYTGNQKGGGTSVNNLAGKTPPRCPECTMAPNHVITHTFLRACTVRPQSLPSGAACRRNCDTALGMGAFCVHDKREGRPHQSRSTYCSTCEHAFTDGRRLLPSRRQPQTCTARQSSEQDNHPAFPRPTSAGHRVCGHRTRQHTAHSAQHATIRNGHRRRELYERAPAPTLSTMRPCHSMWRRMADRCTLLMHRSISAAPPSARQRREPRGNFYGYSGTAGHMQSRTR